MCFLILHFFPRSPVVLRVFRLDWFRGQFQTKILMTFQEQIRPLFKFFSSSNMEFSIEDFSQKKKLVEKSKLTVEYKLSSFSGSVKKVHPKTLKFAKNRSFHCGQKGWFLSYFQRPFNSTLWFLSKYTIIFLVEHLCHPFLRSLFQRAHREPWKWKILC